MNGYFLTGIISGVVGALIAGASIHALDKVPLANERAAHAQDNAQYEARLKAISDTAVIAANKAQEDAASAAQKLAALDTQLSTQKVQNETAAAQYRASLADGSKRLRVAVTSCTAGHGSGAASGNTSAGSVGDGSTYTAELAPAFSSALFGLVDDGDTERAKVTYLQGYIATLQDAGVVAKP